MERGKVAYEKVHLLWCAQISGNYACMMKVVQCGEDDHMMSLWRIRLPLCSCVLELCCNRSLWLQIPLCVRFGPMSYDITQLSRDQGQGQPSGVGLCFNLPLLLF